MSLIEIGNVLIDDTTGEVLDLPEGTEKAAWLAARLFDANEQIKAWERLAGGLKTALVAAQEEKKAQYGDLVVSMRGRIDHIFNPAGFRAWLEDAMLEAPELYELAAAAKGFDTSAVHGRALAAITAATEARPSRTWPVVERIRKSAPVPRQESL